jgi:hypothetical protein
MIVLVYYDNQPEAVQVIRCGAEAIVRIRENITQNETGWQADEYEIHTMWTPNLETRVAENCQSWLEKAKAEVATCPQTEDERITAMATSINDAKAMLNDAEYAIMLMSLGI